MKNISWRVARNVSQFNKKGSVKFMNITQLWELKNNLKWVQKHYYRTNGNQPSTVRAWEIETHIRVQNEVTILAAKRPIFLTSDREVGDFFKYWPRSGCSERRFRTLDKESSVPNLNLVFKSAFPLIYFIILFNSVLKISVPIFNLVFKISVPSFNLVL